MKTPITHKLNDPSRFNCATYYDADGQRIEPEQIIKAVNADKPPLPAWATTEQERLCDSCGHPEVAHMKGDLKCWIGEHCPCTGFKLKNDEA